MGNHATRTRNFDLDGRSLSEQIADVERTQEQLISSLRKQVTWMGVTGLLLGLGFGLSFSLMTARISGCL